MNPDDMDWEAFERLADALSDDLLRAGVAEVEHSHTGRGARVQADALRQALRRGVVGVPADDDLPRDILRILTMRPQREDKP